MYTITQGDLLVRFETPQSPMLSAPTTLDAAHLPSSLKSVHPSRRDALHHSSVVASTIQMPGARPTETIVWRLLLVASRRRRRVGGKAQLGWFWAAERVESPGSRKAAAHGRSALALLSAPLRGLCLARRPRSGASCTGQKRRPATVSEDRRPARATERLPVRSECASAGSDDAEARWAASGRRGGLAQSCSWYRTVDRGRSDLCWPHLQRSCGRFARGLVRVFFSF